MHVNICIQIDTTHTTPFIFARYIYTIMKRYCPLAQRQSLALFQTHHKKCWSSRGSNLFKARGKWTRQARGLTPGMTVQSGNLPLRPLLSMCEMGLKGKLRVTVTTQIQIRNRITPDLPIDSQCLWQNSH